MPCRLVKRSIAILVVILDISPLLEEQTDNVPSTVMSRYRQRRILPFGSPGDVGTSREDPLVEEQTNDVLTTKASR
ncbi:hypothetical protein FB107DRAFT_280763 [Schizophyllum commune]